MYAGHLGLPCFFIQLLQWQEYQVLPSVLLEGHSSSVRSVAFSPDGQTLASGSSDRTIRFLK